MQNKPVRWDTALKKWPLCGFIEFIYFSKHLKNFKMLKHHSEGHLFMQEDSLYSSSLSCSLIPKMTIFLTP